MEKRVHYCVCAISFTTILCEWKCRSSQFRAPVNLKCQFTLKKCMFMLRNMLKPDVYQAIDNKCDPKTIFVYNALKLMPIFLSLCHHPIIMNKHIIRHQLN